MKTIKNILTTAILCGCLFSCSDEWDSHYKQNDPEINSENLVIVESNTLDYLKNDASLSQMFQLLENTGIVKEMQSRDQVYTILVVNNSHFTRTATNDDIYLAKTHICNVAFSPSNMSNGQRMLMWNGKYLDIQKDEDGNIAFNNASVTKITKTNDGYVYELEGFAIAPKSLYETIETLDDNYSIFREMIISRNERTFDRDASTPIGIDETGSTVYDSVFKYTNPYFAAKNFNLMSESLTATMFIPSNDVIEKAWDKAKADLQTWGMTRVDSIYQNWVFQAAFFSKSYNVEELQAAEDITSIFSKQWRMTVQKVDLDNPITLSNGVAYYVTDLKIPANVLIYRLKDYWKWYEYLTEADKAKYYINTNVNWYSISTEVAAWSPDNGAVWPKIENKCVRWVQSDEQRANGEGWSIELPAYNYIDSGNGFYTTQRYKIPPGEYNLCIGMKDKQGHKVEIWAKAANWDEPRLLTTVGPTSSSHHLDRNGQGYPEGYDEVRGQLTDTYGKRNNYDRDGTKAADIVITGDESQEFSIIFKGDDIPVTYKDDGSVNVQNYLFLHHWCLKPTKNCY